MRDAPVTKHTLFRRAVSYIEEVDGDKIHVHFEKLQRAQTIFLDRDEDSWILYSVVLGRAEVTRNARRWRDLARLVWGRNAACELVTFAFDEKDRLIGRVIHPISVLDDEELLAYVKSLATECDRMEYLVSGRDAY